jgi:multidrug efflux system membrane fusion protein
MTVASLRPLVESSWRRVGGAGVVFVLSAVVMAGGCNKAEEKKGGTQAVKVDVTEPITDYTVTDYQDFTGRLAAYKTVDIKARATGYAVQVPFKEGDIVHEGDLLYLIDQRPYKTALESALAQVQVQEANIELAKKTYDRDVQANRAGSLAVSQQQLDQDLAQQKQAEANLRYAKAAVDMAKINLGFTEVRSPINGKVSNRNVDLGNDITTDMTVLTTVVTIDPIYAYFDVDERTFLDLQKRQTPKVLMRLANEDKFTHVGDVDFIDVRVNANAGTMRMRGIFDYREVHDPTWLMAQCGVAVKMLPREAIEKLPATLTPGLFCRTRVPIGEPYKAVLVPDAALQTDQGRKYVYVVALKPRTKKNETTKEEEVVKDDQGNPVMVYKAEYRPVQIGQQIGALRVIKSGLSMKSGEYIITKGQQRVRQNDKTQEFDIAIEKPPNLPESPLGLLAAAEPTEKKMIQPGGTGLEKSGSNSPAGSSDKSKKDS